MPYLRHPACPRRAASAAASPTSGKAVRRWPWNGCRALHCVPWTHILSPGFLKRNHWFRSFANRMPCSQTARSKQDDCRRFPFKNRPRDTPFTVAGAFCREQRTDAVFPHQHARSDAAPGRQAGAADRRRDAAACRLLACPSRQRVRRGLRRRTRPARALKSVLRWPAVAAMRRLANRECLRFSDRVFFVLGLEWRPFC